MMPHVSRLIFNFGAMWIIECKNGSFQIQLILYWISIEVQFCAMCSSIFLIFVASELLSEKPKSLNQIKF